jgi:hypothetical protein
MLAAASAIVILYSIPNGRHGMIDRRVFLKGVIGVGLTASGLPILLPPQKTVKAVGDEELLASLIGVIDEQGKRWDVELDSGLIESLTYAYRKINPSTHLELAIVAWACREDIFMEVDEYVRRRSGIQARNLITPQIETNKYGVPDTFGLWFFREQIDTVLLEITNMPGQATRKKIGLRKLSAEEFQVLLTRQYADMLSSTEVEQLYDMLLFWVSRAMSYYWCATMADRALMIGKTNALR